MRVLRQIVSGGQTGADQGALDGAMELNFPHGGWISAGRKTENGPLAEKYRLRELVSPAYRDRTEKNVTESDGTLIVSHGELTGGSALTRNFAIKHHKPWLNIDFNLVSMREAVDKACPWIISNKIVVVNFAGSRSSSDPLIYEKTRSLVRGMLQADER